MPTKRSKARPRSAARRTPRAAPRRRSPGRAPPAGEPIPLEQLIRLPTLMFPKLSWQRNQVAFYWDRTGRNELYVQPLPRGEARKLTDGTAPLSVRTGPVWDRAGRSLVFTRDTGGDEKFDVYRLPLGADAPIRLTQQPSDMQIAEVSPDDRWVLFTSNAPGRGGRRQMNLWRVPLAGGAAEQLTDYASPVGFEGGSGYSADGRQIAFSTNETPDLNNIDVYVCRDDGSDAHRVFQARVGSKDSYVAWHPDRQHLGIQSDASGAVRPGVLDLADGSVRWFGRGSVDELGADFSPDGRRLLTLRTDGVRVEPFLYDLPGGRAHRIPTEGGLPVSLEFGAKPTELFAWYTNPTRRPEFARLRVDGPPVTLRAADYGELDRRRFVAGRAVRYPSFDGRKIEAILYAPRTTPRGMRRPAIVEVHGGPTGQFFPNFNALNQHLVSRGFVVLEPNVRGSTGYGSEFRDLNRLDWGGGDLQDIVHGARYLGRLPFVDPQRIGIWGGSYGGFMTYVATVKAPELWKAACAWVGITDLELLYSESREHYQYYFREQMGDPETHRDLWRDRSAIHFADRLRAKLLMVHGINDPRCPVDQARIFRDKLLSLGKREGTDFEYLELADEGHGSSDIAQRLRSFSTVSDFFARAL